MYAISDLYVYEDCMQSLSSFSFFFSKKLQNPKNQITPNPQIPSTQMHQWGCVLYYYAYTLQFLKLFMLILPQHKLFGAWLPCSSSSSSSSCLVPNHTNSQTLRSHRSSCLPKQLFTSPQVNLRSFLYMSRVEDACMIQ